jgi:drug/metabolite transporter (DMT)-like permease
MVECTESTPPALPNEGRTALKGLLLMVAATAALGLFPIGARLAYEGGSTPETVALLRHVFSMFFMTVLLARTGDQSIWRAPRLPRNLWPTVFIMGALLAIFAWAYNAAVHYIPVSLAVLLLFTFPAQVVLISALAGLDRATPVRVLAVAVAFTGVVLAVGLSADSPDWRGIALGLLAGFGLAVLTVIGAKTSGQRDSRSLATVMTAVAAALTVAAIVAGPAFAFPDTLRGWVGFLFAGGLAGLGFSLYFAVLPLIGAVRAALLANLEPVVAILAAIAFLGERPGATRFAGIGLVLVAIVALQFSDRHIRRKGNAAR